MTRSVVAVGGRSGADDGGPPADEAVPAYAAELGLPGLADVHTHFMQPRVMAAVWRYFDEPGPLVGRPWPINYRGSQEERLAWLRGLGVRHFTALAYAHKPGIARFLNEWGLGFAAATPGCLQSATFYPEPDAPDYVEEALNAGARLFKVHVQVGAFSLGDPLLRPVWARLQEAGTPVILHAGSDPVPNEHTGPAPVADLLAAYPRLCLVIAHLGSPDYADFLDLAERHEHVYLDTTMAFTDFFEEMNAFPRAELPRLAALRPKVLLGSDFPNIPYDYAHQLRALDRLGLGADWLRDVYWNNMVGLFGLDDCPGAR